MAVRDTSENVWLRGFWIDSVGFTQAYPLVRGKVSKFLPNIGWYVEKRQICVPGVGSTVPVLGYPVSFRVFCLTVSLLSVEISTSLR